MPTRPFFIASSKPQQVGKENSSHIFHFSSANKVQLKIKRHLKIQTAFPVISAHIHLLHIPPPSCI
jgi:hypothetical protein